MPIDKEQIKLWLKDNGYTYEWLAEQCLVSVGTVYAWMAKREIPTVKMDLIRKLINEQKEQKAAIETDRNQWKAFSVMVREEEFSIMEQAAKLDGLTIQEWAEKTLLADTRSIARRHIEKEDTTLPDPSFYTYPEIPLYHAAAGSPVDSHVDTYTPTRELGAGRFAVQAHGDSMTPLIPDGAIVILRDRNTLRTPLLKKGEIYLFNIKGEQTLKRYNTRPATPQEIADEISYTSAKDHTQKVRILQSINPAYPEIIIDHEHITWLGWLDKTDNQ